MKNYFILLLLVFFSVSCSTTKSARVKVPKIPKAHFASKKDIKKFSDNFAKKDWTKFDTTITPVIDTIKTGNY